MLCFILGCMIGGAVGVIAMCIFTVSGQQSRMEEAQHNESNE
jgi:hypothetical protein